MLCGQASEQRDALRKSVTLKFQKTANNFFYSESPVSLWDAIKITGSVALNESA
ncbi:hypothetical protein XBKB1_1160006 [Xenorhabdus bovienii str. kraussei Becker Underwood]|uniref:Uncharacterized protein n=1 Tax=Xenorhabdus bovienii str. kraussei Becker Underwood TaxID=1398204 RepID=A0A077PNY2_XENBV|nr:hypothetical protein XBKB1_1160006 [Xenorhabdus bovienii str. kraussei Becker Underwood]